MNSKPAIIDLFCVCDGFMLEMDGAGGVLVRVMAICRDRKRVLW